MSRHHHRAEISGGAGGGAGRGPLAPDTSPVRTESAAVAADGRGAAVEGDQLAARRAADVAHAAAVEVANHPRGRA